VDVSADKNMPPEEVLFVQLISMFQMAAMQHLGKLLNPVTNAVERDLDQAKITISILEMLERKTKGNRTDPETEFLQKALFELRMNYVDEVNASKKEKKQGEEEAGDKVAGTQSAADGPEEADEDTKPDPAGNDA
jgi:hypothetical protein